MYNQAISDSLKQRLPALDIAKKLFLAYPTHAFIDKYEMGFQIIDAISKWFDVPFTDIQVVGSGKFGYSYYQQREFILAESDLDIAIINADLFKFYSEVVYHETDGFRDNTGFKKTAVQDDYRQYRANILNGMFRPDLMPYCDSKLRWKKFFNELSNKYLDTFKNINGGIYFSHLYFEYKQSSLIEDFKNIK